MKYERLKKLCKWAQSSLSKFYGKLSHRSAKGAQRWALTLRILATGKSYRSLPLQFRISRSAISYIVNEVC